MAQPRYNAVLQGFIRQWRPNDAELDKRFMDDIRSLLEAILKPPANVFEVETILSDAGGKVVIRLGDYEAQLDPLDAQHLGISIIEAATSARTESWLTRFLLERLTLPHEVATQMIAESRGYRVAEMQRQAPTIEPYMLQSSNESRHDTGWHPGRPPRRCSAVLRVWRAIVLRFSSQAVQQRGRQDQIDEQRQRQQAPVAQCFAVRRPRPLLQHVVILLHRLPIVKATSITSRNSSRPGQPAAIART